MITAVATTILLTIALIKADDSDTSNQKPLYHVTPEQGHWMNDPNGPMYFNGYYHLFYQYNPDGIVWGNMSWGHVVSQDLIFWDREPVALYNDMPYDINGCFSGSAAITGDNNPYLFYTCVNSNDWELQCVAERDPDSSTYNTTLTDWIKSPANPIIFAGSDGLGVANFRDPTLWQLSSPPSGNEPWNMIIAATTSEHVGIIALYTTSEESFPYGWNYEGPIWSAANPDSAYHTWMIECPDLFSAKPTSNWDFTANTNMPYILKYSVMETRQDIYEVGKYATTSTGGSVFKRDLTYSNPFATAEGQSNGLLYDYGPENTFYASKTFFDSQRGQRVLWGWSPEQGSEEDAIARGFQGVQSLPRSLFLDTTAKILRSQPASNVVSGLSGNTLYQYTYSQSSHELNDEAGQTVLSTTASDSNGSIIEVLPIQGDQIGISVAFVATADCTSLKDLEGFNFGLQVRRSSDGANYTSYGFSIQETQVLLDSAESPEKPADSFPDSAVDRNSTNEQARGSSLGIIPAVRASLNSSRSGGTTPNQTVDVPIPGQTNDPTMFFASDDDSDSQNFAFNFQLFLDHSLSEVFMQKGALAATMRIYPDDDDKGLAWYITRSNGVQSSDKCLLSPSSTEGDKCGICLYSITVKELQSIWKNADDVVK